jgi:hypothetical protein
MATGTRIILKKGSGEPDPLDLEIAEIAVDVVNGDLYTKLQSFEVKNLTSGVDGGTGSSVHIGDSPPADPQEGQQWMEVPTDGEATMWIYDGGKWLQQPGGKDGADGADGGIEEAPQDSLQYARQDGGWAEVQSGLWTDNGDTSISYTAGNVGIGYFTPTAKLHVFDDTAPCLMRVQGLGAGNSAGIQILGRNSSNASAPWTIQTEEDLSLSVGTGGSDAMRINALGGVYFGTTGTAIGSGNLIVNEGVYVGAASGNNQIRSSSSGNGSATLYIGNAAIQVASDRRLKENIIDTSMSALDKLDQVRVVDFTWNDPNDTAVNNRNARGTWTGIIAQELVDVFPFAVNAPRNEDDLSIDEESESTWHVDQDQLVPVLIKAIQELKAEVAALKGA